MRKRLRKFVVFLISFSMIISLGTLSYCEELIADAPAIEESLIEEPVVEEPVVEEAVVEEAVVEEPVVEEPVMEEPVVEEPVVEEPVVEEPVIEEPVIEEPVVEEPVVEAPLFQEPLLLEPAIMEPVFIEQIIPRDVSVFASVDTDYDSYTNGDTIEYTVLIENNGTEIIENISVSDEMGLDEKFGSLSPEGNIKIPGHYYIDKYNRIDSLGNSIEISAYCGGERISLRVGFQVSVEVPLGSITIRNNVEGLDYNGEEFDILVVGPNNYQCYVSLGDDEKITLNDIFLGEYSIVPMDSMNYSAAMTRDYVEITGTNPDADADVEYMEVNSGWFHHSDQESISVLDIGVEDIYFRSNELQSTTSYDGSDEVYIELEPLIILVDQIQETVQLEGEAVQEVATPTEEAASEPVVEDEGNEAPDSVQALQPIGSETEAGPVIEDPVVEEPVIEEPEAIIPEDPPEESIGEVDTQNIDEGTEEPGTPVEPEEMTAPKDPEEVQIDSV